MRCDASRCSNTLGRCADCPRLSSYDVTEQPVDKPVEPPRSRITVELHGNAALALTELRDYIAGLERRIETLESRTRWH